MSKLLGNTTISPSPDFSFRDEGSIVLLTPLSPAAHEFVEARIGQDGFQPFWPTVVIEKRDAQAILQGVLAEGLVIARPESRGDRTRMCKLLRIKTEAATHLVMRDWAGKKLLDIDLPGVSVTVAVPSDAKIEIEPDERTT